MQGKHIAVICLFLTLALAQDSDWVQLYQGFTKSEFKTTDDWIVTNSETNNYFFTCGRNNMILGGPYAFNKKAAVARTFKIPAHYQVRVKVQLWKLKNWDNRRMIIVVDGNQWETLWGFTEGKSICGGAAGNDAFYDITFDVQHDQPALSILFTSTLEGKAWNQSWGIKNIEILYRPCPGACAVCNGPDPDKCSMWVPSAWNFFDISGPEGWKATNGKLEKNTCSGIPFLGGFNNLGTKAEINKIIQPLVPHYRIRISFQFWKIDKWNNDQAQLWVDRKLTWYQNFQYSEGVELCGGDPDRLPQKIVNIAQEAPHNFDGVNLKLTSTLPTESTVSSWGIRQFYLYVAKCADNCQVCTGPRGGDCTVCIPPYVMENGACVDKGNWILQDKDLNGNSFSAVDKDWTVEGAKDVANPITDCGGTAIFGGYNMFGKKAKVTRVFKKLPAHKRIRILVEVWKIDAWDGETLYINVDDKKVWEQSFGWNDPGSYDLCGDTNNVWPEKKMTVEIILGHADKNVKFEVTSNLKGDASTQSWGIRDFSLWYEAADQCASLFTECNYGGQSFDICDQEPNFQLKKYPSIIKSVMVPKDFTLVLYDESDFGGLKVSYSESQACIPKMKFSFVELKSQAEVQQNKTEEAAVTITPQE